MDILGTIGVIGIGVAGLIWLGAIIYAIVRTIADPAIGGVLKLLWVIVILAFPLVGLIIWIIAHDRINASIGR